MSVENAYMHLWADCHPQQLPHRFNGRKVMEVAVSESAQHERYYTKNTTSDSEMASNFEQKW
jgi:hypothetical protein